ncbi:MAG: radical SAM protein [Planctomycetaceae bacterium]|jgi:MoaA/NifB/PqqE/SkfB family radical SAM enzyme|nr:radical SAM protein [Planctomycetaceae bacterium]
MESTKKNPDISHVYDFYQKGNFVKTLTQKHGQNYLRYREKWDRAQKGEYLSEQPLYIVIGTNSNCNLRCVMCPFRKFHKQERILLDSKLLQKIANECAMYEIPSLAIGTTGECLLHPDICEILSLFSKSKTGLLDFFIITNGTQLTEKISRHIVKEGLDRISISIDAATPDTYHTIRGGNLIQLEKNIEQFLKIRQEANSPTPILRVTFLKQQINAHEQDLFLEKWIDKADLIAISDDVIIHPPISEVHNYSHIKPFCCYEPWQRLIIDHFGNIYPCCGGGAALCEESLQEYLLLGNIRNMTIVDAWNGTKIRTLRQSFENGKNWPICQWCKAHREKII